MGKIDIELEITINASVEEVWAVFSDFRAYSAWSPTIHFVASVPEVGEKVAVLLQQPNGKKMTMHPKILRLSPYKELRWLGRVLLPGIFDGEHYFILKPKADGATHFIQGERFNGILVPFFKKMILGSTKEGFEAFNIALKNRVEDRKNTNL